MRRTICTALALSVALWVMPACSPPFTPPAAFDTRLDDAVRAYDLSALAARLPNLPAGAEHDYVAGILAVRSGNYGQGIELLNKALADLRSKHRAGAALALDALGDAYTLAFRYQDAARAYEELQRDFSGVPPRDVSDDVALARIVRDVPAQTIVWNGAVHLQTTRNPIGSIIAELEANGVRAQWLIDTGANQSVITNSFMARLGVTPLPGSALVGSGITGIKSPLRAGVIPELHVGGATVRNVIVLVLDDENLRIGPPDQRYQIDAILGLPVLQALGAITFVHAGEFLAEEPKGETAGSQIYMRGLTPAIEAEIDGMPLLFTFDTGASSTDFSIRYFERFREKKQASWQTRIIQTGGSGGMVTRTMFIEPRVDLRIGGVPITLENVSIPSTRANADINLMFGNFGQDLVDGFECYTLDFRHMRFALGPRREPASP